MINDYDSPRADFNNWEVVEGLIDKIQDKVYKLSVECKEALRKTYNLE